MCNDHQSMHDGDYLFWLDIAGEMPDGFFVGATMYTLKGLLGSTWSMIAPIEWSRVPPALGTGRYAWSCRTCANSHLLNFCWSKKCMWSYTTCFGFVLTLTGEITMSFLVRNWNWPWWMLWVLLHEPLLPHPKKCRILCVFEPLSDNVLCLWAPHEQA